MANHICFDAIAHELTWMQHQIAQQIASDIASCLQGRRPKTPPTRTKLLLQAEQNLLDARELLDRARSA